LAGRRLFAIAERLDGFDGALVQPFMPNGPGIAINIGALPGLSRLDVPDRNPPRFSRFQQLARQAMRSIAERELTTEVFRAVVYRLAVDCMEINEKGREWRPACRAI
jgi:hypothetical protein